MTYRQIAEQIPAEYRQEILATNMISQAIAISTDPGMIYLGTVWNEYVSKEDLTCGMCLTRLLKNWQQLQPVMIEMEKESNLLTGL